MNEVVGGTAAIWWRRALMACALLPLVLASVTSWGLGVGLDQDGGEILRVIPDLRAGSYTPSRTSGFPLYEYLAAAVVNVSVLQTLSVLFTAATLVLLAVLVHPTTSWIGLLGWATYALLPGTVASATSVIEIPLLALLITLLWWLLLCSKARWGLTVVSALVVLTRPDAALVVLSTTLVWTIWRRERQAGRFMISGAAIGITAILILNRGIPNGELLTEALIRSMARAAVSLSTLTNVVGLLGLIGLALGLSIAAIGRGPDRDRTFYSRWLLAVLAVVAVRFAVLPDELDYLLGAIITLVVLAPRVAGTRLVTVSLSVLFIGMASTSVVTVSLFQRTDPWDANPHFSPSVNAGGVVQDIQARRATTIRKTPEYQAYFGQGSQTLVLPRDTWYQIFSPRFAASYGQYQVLLGCTGLTSRSEPPGWRLSQPAGVYEDVQIYLDGQEPQCEVVADRVGSQWRILARDLPGSGVDGG